jgi:hypothetical protein
MPDTEDLRPHPILEFVARLLSPEKIPGVVGFVFMALLQIASWRGAIDLYMPAFRMVGGAAMPIADFLFSPGFSITLAFFSGFYLWYVSKDDKPAQEIRRAESVAWTVLAVFAVPVVCITLFGFFLTNSGIPDIAQAVEQRLAERSLTPNQSKKLYDALRNIASKILPVDLSAARSPESLNYGRLIFQVMKDAGLDLNNQRAVRPIDLDNTSETGMIIFAKDDVPSRASAAAIRDAFAQAGLVVQIVVSNDAPDKLIELLVAYRKRPVDATLRGAVSV